MKAKLSNQPAWASWPKQLPSSHSYYPISLRKKWKPWSEGYPFEFLFSFFSVFQTEQCEGDTFHFNKNWCLLRFTKPAYNSTVRDVRHENERRGMEWLIVESSYVVGFLGVISTGAPGDGMSMGNMSTHISTLPWRQTNNQLQTVSHHNLWRTSCQVLLEICKYVMNYTITLASTQSSSQRWVEIRRGELRATCKVKKNYCLSFVSFSLRFFLKNWTDTSSTDRLQKWEMKWEVSGTKSISVEMIVFVLLF